MEKIQVCMSFLVLMLLRARPDSAGLWDSGARLPPGYGLRHGPAGALGVRQPETLLGEARLESGLTLTLQVLLPFKQKLQGWRLASLLCSQCTFWQRGNGVAAGTVHLFPACPRPLPGLWFLRGLEARPDACCGISIFLEIESASCRPPGGGLCRFQAGGQERGGATDRPLLWLKPRGANRSGRVRRGRRGTRGQGAPLQVCVVQGSRSRGGGGVAELPFLYLHVR